MNEASGAEWIAAVGTAGTLVVGMFVLAREQRDRRRAQARQVNAWAAAIQPKREKTETGTLVGMEGNCVVVETVNNSSEPVYDFHAWVHHNFGRNSPVTGSQEQSILPPGSHTIYVDGIQIPEGGLAGMPYVDVTFRDTAGRRWQRLHSGELSRDRTSRSGRERLLRFRLRRWRRVISTRTRLIARGTYLSHKRRTRERKTTQNDG